MSARTRKWKTSKQNHSTQLCTMQIESDQHHTPVQSTFPTHTPTATRAQQYQTSTSTTKQMNCASTRQHKTTHRNTQTTKQEKKTHYETQACISDCFQSLFATDAKSLLPVSMANIEHMAAIKNKLQQSTRNENTW